MEKESVEQADGAFKKYFNYKESWTSSLRQMKIKLVQKEKLAQHDVTPEKSPYTDVLPKQTAFKDETSKTFKK